MISRVGQMVCELLVIAGINLQTQGEIGMKNRVTRKTGWNIPWASHLHIGHCIP
jgi:hypothetical protein